MWKDIKKMSNEEIQSELDNLKKVREISANVNVEKILNEEIDLSPLKEVNLTIAANGALYHRVQGFLPQIMENLYDERKAYKKKMLAAESQYEKTPTKKLEKDISKFNNIQMARKIQLNSAYGAIGNQYFRYFKLANAEAITLSGQVAAQWIENRMNKYLNKLLDTGDADYVIASDTDSIYINLGPLVDKLFGPKNSDTAKVVNVLDKICAEQLEPFIDKNYQRLADYVSAHKQKMQMKRECIAERGIWTAKKRYILSVWNSEGVSYLESGYKLKIKGIEAIKSSTPAPCRKMLKDSFHILLKGTESDAIEFIEKCRSEFKQLSPEEVAFPRSVSDVRKYHSSSDIYTKGTPIHVRGALLFNHYIKENKLDRKYSLIQNGEKIKYLYLKKPNIIRENVFSFIQDFPRELGLDKYIDYDLQFEKSFLEPLKTILNCIGWSHEKTANLDSFFI